MHKYAAGEPTIRTLPNNVATHGFTNIFTDLKDKGFEIRDLFVIGLNRSCGRLIVDTEDRAHAAQAALEPTYKTFISRLPETGDWEVTYDRRDPDGVIPDHFVTKIVMKDGSTPVLNGRPNK